ncbi:MAG TPA: hypothetical protein VKG63_03445 [Steroidobacteraceae bacterium]|nr:hypothetical protein [Steroidobacteraceae bacterium]
MRSGGIAAWIGVAAVVFSSAFAEEPPAAAEQMLAPVPKVKSLGAGIHYPDSAKRVRAE